MKLPLAYYGSPSLRKKARPVEKITPEIKAFVADLLETMHASNGIGLAATQVHNEFAIFVTCVPVPGPDNRWHPGKDRIFINPKILGYSEELFTWDDGCLSIPGIFCPVNRPYKIRIQAQDLDGNIFEEDMEALFAFNFMHENDHLNGVLFIDRMDRKSRKEIEPILARIKRDYHGKQT